MRIDFSKYKNIVVLTGAGVSVASGLRTYRGPGGVWDEYKVEEYGHARCLAEHPERTWQFFGGRRDAVRKAVPNRAHEALMLLESHLNADQQFVLVTQNTDGLHRRANSQHVAEIHGNILVTRCSNEACDFPPFTDYETHVDAVPRCPQCDSILRPDIVLFEERPLLGPMWETKRALRNCDLFLAIGTSGSVAPASDFVRGAEYAGARTIYINIEPLTPPNSFFKEEVIGRAEDVLPKLFGLSL